MVPKIRTTVHLKHVVSKANKNRTVGCCMFITQPTFLGGDIMTTNPAFILRNIFDKKILVPIKKNTIGDTPILLNNTAAEIWNKSNECANESELVNAISELFGLQSGSEDWLAVIEFITEMTRIGLIIQGK